MQRLIKIYLSFSLALLPAWAQGDVSSADKAEITRMYGVASECARFKFVDGVFSIRMGTYQVWTEDKREVSLEAERAAVTALLQGANRVKFQFPLEKFQRIDSKTIACKTRHVFSVEALSASTGKQSTTVYEAPVWDIWKHTTLGWRLSSTTLTGKQQRRKLDLFEADKDMPAW